MSAILGVTNARTYHMMAVPTAAMGALALVTVVWTVDQPLCTVVPTRQRTNTVDDEVHR